MMANMRYLYNETFCAEIIMMMIIIKTMIWKENVIILHVSNYHHHHHQRQGFQTRIFFLVKLDKMEQQKKSHRSFFFWWEKKKKKSTLYYTWNDQILEFFFSIYSWYVWGSHPDKCQALVFCFYIYCLTYLTIFFVLVVFSWSIRDRI